MEEFGRPSRLHSTVGFKCREATLDELQDPIYVVPAVCPLRSEGGRQHAASHGVSQNCYSTEMDDIPARELRNDVSGVLRRVESGEHLRVTVSGRPVAELSPLPARPTMILWDDLVNGSQLWRADAGLARELAELNPGTTDDIPIP